MYKENINPVFDKLNEFIKKYYQNQLIKGAIYTISILIIFFLLFTIIEYISSFDVNGRTFLFWTYILINFFVFVKLIAIPLLNLFKLGKTLNYKDAAKIIGKHFPEIDDKLINLLELSEISNSQNALIMASIDQKAHELSPISFKNAIDFSVNTKHLKWILIPIIIIASFIISGKYYILSESSARIIKHNTFFEPKAPFNYIILNENLSCKQFDDFLLKIKVEGHEIPSEIFIVWGENKFKLKNLTNNEFNYTFSRVHTDLEFQLSAGGYLSKKYAIKSLLQPKIVDMQINIVHPKHTNKKPELIENNGDFTISEGGLARWNINLENANNYTFLINDKIIHRSYEKEIQITQKIFQSTNYSIIISNTNNLSDTLTYSIKVILDQFPKINLVQSYDTINSIHLFSGVIEDDYILEKLELIYTYNSNDSSIESSEEILIQKKSLEQFFHAVNFEKLTIDAGTELKYYFKVWDNDGVNGSKFTKSNIFTYKKETKDELIAKKDIANTKTKEGLSTSISMSKEIQKAIKALNKKMLQKKNIGWEEKQKIKAILKKQQELEKKIADTQKKNSENLKNKEKLNSSIIEKQKKLEELMKQVLDEEMQKLLNEIDKMMDSAKTEKLKELLEKLNAENQDLEKELDRELELFKQLEFEQKLEEILEKINALKKQQDELKNKTEGNKNDKEGKLIKEQEKLNEKMDEVKKELQILRKKNAQLEEKNEMPKTQKLENSIQEKMQESQDALEKGKKNKSKKAQQDVIDKIMQLENILQQMQQSTADSKAIEDMESLRKILENLITLSFDQEYLMEDVNNTPRNSPEFVHIVQQQNKLYDNSQIIEDSLFALSKRVVEIQATINKEITSIKANMEKTTRKLEARDINAAVTKQQFIMTSTNNLALLLSEILEQMQNNLEMPPSQCNTPRNCTKPNPNCKKPSMSELKKAQKKLNEQMKKEGKDRGKNKKGCENGEERSKELMNLAKQQEQIRKQLNELRDEIGKNGEKGKIDKALEDMEENERDIINDRITQETIKRQEEILSRLLETEDSNREQDEDEQRQSNEWEFKLTNTKTEDFIKYDQIIKAQEELMKTTPIQLTPFYKKKVNSYFNSIIND